MSRIWTASRRLQRGFFTLPGGMGSAFPPGGAGPTPPPYDTDLVVHFDAADLSTLALSGSDVDSWTCKASAQVWSQTSVNRPVVSSTYFSPRGINFDTSGGNRKWLEGSGITIPVPNTTFIVANVANTGNTALGLYGGSSSSRQECFLVYVSGASQKYTQYVLTLSPLFYLNSVAINTPDKIVAGFYSTNTSLGTFNLERNRSNVNDVSAGTTAPSTINVAYLGSNDAALPSQGHVAEVLSYNRYLDSTERTAVYDYLSAKWGTP